MTAMEIDRQLFLDTMKRNAKGQAIGCKPIDYDPTKLPERAAIERKYDGIGLNFLWKNAGGAWARTHEGVTMHCAGRFIGDLMRLAYCHDNGGAFLQGEFVEPAGFEAALSSMARGKPSPDAYVVIWDAVEHLPWEGRNADIPLEHRRMRLEQCFKAVAPMTNLILAEQQAVFGAHNPAAIMEAAEAAWADGHEGIVVKDLAAPFLRGRSQSWMRIKRGETVDCYIVDVTDIRADGFLLTCLLTGQLPIRVWVAGKDAAEFRRDRMVELKHRGITAKGLYRSPSFNRFRDDKEG